jgi:hypothetical protein
MEKVRKRYVKDGTDEFTIDYVPKEGHYEIHAIDYPWCPYNDDIHQTHLYTSGVVCVTKGREPKDLETAIAIARVWMNNYSIYCRTGESPNKGGRIIT